jgi:predicted ATP-grasp superfamily ATP-dependent carboligase
MSPSAYLSSLRGPLEHAMISRDDPLPGIADIPLTALIHLRRYLRRQGAGRKPAAVVE